VLKNGRVISLSLKIGFTSIMLVLLYIQLTRQSNLREMFELFQKRLSSADYWFLVFAFALMPFNWLTETLKWQGLMKQHQKISVWRGFQAVLGGVSFSLFTPNRVGEYGGRVLFVDAEHRWKSFIINIVGNISQILAILSFGSFGMLWLYAHAAGSDLYLLWVSAAFSAIGIFLLCIAFFNIDIFIPLARRIPYVHKIKRYAKDIVLLRQFARHELLVVLFWSVLRFLIYSLQYYLVVRFYDIDASAINLFAAIFMIFLLQTGIPLPPVLGLVARGSVAVHIFGFFQAAPLSALAATFTLWVINLILPSFLGVGFILNINLARIIGYEKK
jgi:Lysylphosphatidylglycerol synthase TM region